MWGWIGDGLQFSYLGPTIAFIAFSIALIIVTGLRDIISHGEVPW